MRFSFAAIVFFGIANSVIAQPKAARAYTAPSQLKVPKSSFAPILTQSGYPQTTVYVRNQSDAYFSAMIGNVEWSSFPAWEPLPRARLQRMANQEGKAIDVYKGGEKLETINPIKGTK